jgi:hypothetical protein
MIGRPNPCYFPSRGVSAIYLKMLRSLRKQIFWIEEPKVRNVGFINSISGTGTTNADKVIQRFKMWEEALEEIVGIPKTENRLFSREFKKKLYDQNPTCSLCGNAIMLNSFQNS